MNTVRVRSSVRWVVLAAALVGSFAPLAVGTARGDIVTYASTDVPKTIPDDDDLGITSVLVVPDSFVVEDLNLIFDELFHESVSDLHIELASPAGTTAILIMSAVSEGGILEGLGIRDNFIGTIFDDQAPTNLRDAFFDNHLGTYNIAHASVGDHPLSIFNGEDALGTWTLHVSDRESFDSGELVLWSLRFTNSVPEPTSLALLGLGLGFVWIAARRTIRPSPGGRQG